MPKNIFYNRKLINQDSNIKKLHTHQILKLKKNVDINKLLNRVKINQSYEKKKKIIILSLGISILTLMGLFISMVK